MCYTAIVQKVQGHKYSEKVEKETRDMIFSAIFTKTYINDEGFGLIAKNIDSDVYYRIRDMQEKAFLKKIKENNYLEKDIVSLHFRKATEGEVKVSNIHFWQSLGFYFAHNGWAYYLKDKTGKRSDSLLFFRLLSKKIKAYKKHKWKKITEIMIDLREKYLSGRGFLIKGNKALLFGDLKMYMVNGCFLVFSSGKLDFKQYYNKQFGDLIFCYSKNECDLINEQVSGVYLWDFRKQKLKEILHEKAVLYPEYYNDPEYFKYSKYHHE